VAETVYCLLCATSWRRRCASTMFGVLLAAATTSTWWGFHVPGPRHHPMWVYGAILSFITGGGVTFLTHLLLWFWYKEHETLRRYQAYHAQQVSVVLEMSDRVRNALQVICHAGWMPKDADLFAMVQDSVARIESELRHLVNECDHANHESPGHGGIEPAARRVLSAYAASQRRASRGIARPSAGYPATKDSERAANSR
jgi:hypothetical protein